MKPHTSNQILKGRRGFTLLEIILYVGISSTILLLAVLFFSSIFSSRIKSQTITDLDEQGLQVMQVILQTIRNAEGINSPVPGNSSSVLSLDALDPADDPTIIDVFGGEIKIKEGVASAVALTNSKVIVSELRFENFSRTLTPGSISVSFSLDYINPENKNELDYSSNFYGSASLR